jgi:plasmid stabilization system protein ParE
LGDGEKDDSGEPEEEAIMAVRASTDPRAASELEEAAIWYEGKAAGLGYALFEEVDRTVAFIAEFPEAGAALSLRQPMIRFRPVDRFPYSVVYLLMEGQVVVLAVAHQHRRPGYWRYRMRRHRRES